MLLEALTLIVGYYVFATAVTYGYAVFKNWELTNDWELKIVNSCVGLVRIPKVFTFWMGKKVTS